jgi:hypothetical protein
LQEDTKEAICLANEVEAHRRRWSLRILGIPPPANKFETSDEAKELVLRFITTELNIQNIHLAE